ncbi:MAG TPA: hypothetical protein VNA16_07655 [Abditibacteriaceae bacterium]|nr:hypothetical protein [Abditibacteriaceae bacterium]
MRQFTGRNLLLVDDHDVLYRSGTKRVLHPLTRQPQNPMLRGGENPWEADIAYNSVYRDELSGKYQLWYQAFAGGYADERTHRCTVCYAESEDGLTWTKPNLGLHSFNGIEETNIVLLGNAGRSDRYGASVIVDQLDNDPGRRYKMAYFDFSKDSTASGREYPGLSVAFSPDGIHWKKHPQAPLLRIAYSGVGEPLPYQGRETEEGWSLSLTMSDAFDVFYDPRIRAFVAYGKMWIDGPDGLMHWKHAVGRTQSNDFLHWSKAELVLTPDDLDPPYIEFHTTPVFFYNDCYFATLQILNRGERGGVIDIELALSRDGLQWQRPFRQPFFLPRSDGNQFESGSLFTNATPIFLEGEVRFYYGAYGQGATGPAHQEHSGVGLATLPRDRFAGIRPQQQIGQITLRPLEISNCQDITTNANAGAGAVRVEVLDANGFRVRGFTREDAIPIRGDSLGHTVRWKNKVISQLPPGRYMLRLHLENAEIFAVTLEDKP